MAYGIMRCEKRKTGSCGGLQNEANREKDNEKNFVASDIDWTKTGDNEYLMKSNNWNQSVKDVLSSHRIDKHRKDAVVLIDGFYGASPEFFQDKSKDEIRAYFKDCLEYHKNHYGFTINAVIHYDEATPHMHVASVPIVQKNDGLWKLSAKDLMGNVKAYRDRQDSFHENVSSKYGLERGEISSPEHHREHLTTLEYKEHQTARDVALYDKQIERSKEILSDVQIRIKSGHEEEKAINSRIKLKNEKLDEIDGRIVDAKNLKKERAGTTIFGKEKDEITIPYEEYRTLYKTAKKANDIESREKDILHQKELLKTALEKANKIDYYLQVESARIAKEAVENELENKKRDYDLERYLSKSESGKRILEQYKNQYKNTVNDTIVRAKQIAKNEAAKHDRDFEI